MKLVRMTADLLLPDHADDCDVTELGIDTLVLGGYLPVVLELTCQPARFVVGEDPDDQRLHTEECMRWQAPCDGSCVR